MKLSTTLIALLPFILSVSSSPLLSSRQEEDPCTESSGGPSPEAKEAVRTFVINDVFGSGEFCPPGGSSQPPDYCAVCQGALIQFSREASDARCISTDELNEALGEFPEGGDICVKNIRDDQYLQVLFANTENVTQDPPCANVC